MCVKVKSTGKLAVHTTSGTSTSTCASTSALSAGAMQSVESFHKICAKVLNRYRSQREGLGLKYAMDHLLLMTSPKYQLRNNER